MAAATGGAIETLTQPAERGPSLHPAAAMAGLTGCTVEWYLGCMAKVAGGVCKSPEGETMGSESMKMATASRKEGGMIAVPTDMIADEMSGLCDIMTGVVTKTQMQYSLLTHPACWHTTHVRM